MSNRNENISTVIVTHLDKWMLDIPCSILDIQTLLSHYIDMFKFRKNSI